MATTKKTSAKKTTAKKTTAKKAPTKPTTVKDKGLAAFAEQAVWAYAGIVNDVVQLAVEAPKHIPTTREDLAKTREGLVENGESFVSQIRANMNNVVSSLNSRFEAKATEGHKAAEQLATNPRVERVTATFKPVVDQAGNTRSQVKAAVTSLGKISDTAAEAGRMQAGNARSQVKAAATSTRKTVDAAVDAGRKLAS